MRSRRRLSLLYRHYCWHDFLLVGIIVKEQVLLLEIAAIAARHGNHKTAAGEVRAADKHSGRLAVDGNLQHGVVDIVVAIAHRILDDVGTLGVEHQFHAGTIRIACLELGRIGIFLLNSPSHKMLKTDAMPC